MVPTSSSALGHMAYATYFGPQGGEGVCPFIPVPLEVVTTKVNIIRTNAPGHRWGFEPRPPRLAHQNYSITLQTVLPFYFAMSTINPIDHTLCVTSSSFGHTGKAFVPATLCGPWVCFTEQLFEVGSQFFHISYPPIKFHLLFHLI